MKVIGPLKIIFSHYGYKNGGGFSRSYVLARELALLGHDVTFLTSQSKGFVFPYKREKVDRLTLVSFPDLVPSAILEKGFGILTPLLKTIYILLKTYDIIHSDSGQRPNSGLPCIIYKYFHKVTYVSEWWDFFGKGGQYDLRPFYGKYTIGLWDRLTEVRNRKISDGVVALSKFTMNRAIKNSIPEERISVIHGGSDVARIKFYPDNRDLKKKYGVPVDSLTFGFIGMTESEFFDVVPFIKAMAHLKTKYNVNWITTGVKIKEHLRKQYSIGEELFEFGWLNYEEFCKVIGIADVFILLSRENSLSVARWPNKIGDYLASGRLILANPIGDLVDIMNKYQDSFISTKWDNHDIEINIIRLVQIKQELLLRGMKNRILAENDFSWREKSLELQDFYYKILRLKAIQCD